VVVKKTNSLFKRELDISLFTGIGATVSNKNELALSYEQALNAANSLKLSGIDGVQFYSDLSDYVETDLLFLLAEEQLNFENMILRGDEYSQKYLEGLFQRYVERHNLSYTYILQFMRAINSLLIGILHTFHSKGLLCTNDMNHYFSLLMECNTIPELKSKSFELINHLINSVDKAVIPPENNNITMAKEYIALNYSNVHLSNTMIADACNISDSYLSFIFKTKTGVNLNNYISEYRIDKAVELMENTDMLIRDISIECGILSINSFNRLFKKYKGISPQEFRKNHNKET
jgi:two-component system response regulator YesN